MKNGIAFTRTPKEALRIVYLTDKNGADYHSCLEGA
jgi:hypothetical protein